MPIRAGVVAWLAIPLCAALLYAGALAAPFVFDDIPNIVANPALHWNELSLENARAAALESPNPRPVANLSFALNYYAGRFDPRGYRAVNVAIHAGNGLLVYLLARLLLRRARALGASRLSPRDEALAALFAGLVFVAHPLQVQSVTFIVQRMSSLGAGFHLAALCCWLGGREAAGGRRAALWAACALAFLLGLGTKQSAAMLPFSIWWTEWVFYRERDSRRLRRALPWLLAAALAVAAALFWQLDLGSRYAARGAALGERLLTQARVTWLYLGLALWPLPSRLNLLWELEPSRSLFQPPVTALALFGLGLWAAAAAGLARRQPLLAFALGWFLLQLAMEAALPLWLVFEHRTYLPLAGAAIALPALLFPALGARAGSALLAALVAALALGTHARNQVWRDAVRLWSDVVAKSPRSALAHDELGMALGGAGRPIAAARHYLESLRLDPRPPETWLHAGDALVRLGASELGLALMQESERRDPRAWAPPHALGAVWLERGRPDLAIPLLTRARDLAPELPLLHYALGVAEERRGRLDAAEAHYREALRRDPRHPGARVNLGVLAMRRGAPREAALLLAQALEFAPDSLVARNNLAWLLATAEDASLRDPPRAVALAEAARDGGGAADPDVLDTLAAAYAAAGRFEPAVEAAEAAASAAAASGDLEGALRIRARAELYRAGRPYLEPAAAP